MLLSAPSAFTLSAFLLATSAPQGGCGRAGPRSRSSICLYIDKGEELYHANNSCKRVSLPHRFDNYGGRASKHRPCGGLWFFLTARLPCLERARHATPHLCSFRT